MDISFASQTIFNLGPLPVTNTLLMSWIAMAVLIIAGLAATQKLDRVPGRFQNIVETIIEGALNFFSSVTGSRKEAEKIFPLIFTFFIFILFANWLGIMPGGGTIGTTSSGSFVPFFRSTYSDLNMTLALTFISVVATQVLAIRALGVKVHVGKFISFRSPVSFFVGILELIAELAKILSFSFRLFGNVFAGEVLLAVILGLVPFIAPIPFLGMELFVGFIQALVFSMLTLVFIKVATTQVEHH